MPPTVPSSTKFHGVDPSVPTANKGSALANSLREAYSIEDIAAKISEINNAQTGAVQFTDQQYSSGSPLALTAATPVQLTNNATVGGLGVFNISAPTLGEAWLDSTGKITPDNSNGDSYLVRVGFTIQPSQTNKAVLLTLDIGGAQGVIWASQSVLAKGTAAQQVTFDMHIYALGTFLANGGTINIETDSATANVYDIVFLVEKINKVSV